MEIIQTMCGFRRALDNLVTQVMGEGASECTRLPVLQALVYRSETCTIGQLSA